MKRLPYLLVTVLFYVAPLALAVWLSGARPELHGAALAVGLGATVVHMIFTAERLKDAGRSAVACLLLLFPLVNLILIAACLAWPSKGLAAVEAA